MVGGPGFQLTSALKHCVFNKPDNFKLYSTNNREFVDRKVILVFSLTTEMSAGQSDGHNQICACQNTTNPANRVFVPVNDRDRMLISRLVVVSQILCRHSQLVGTKTDLAYLH